MSRFSSLLLLCIMVFSCVAQAQSSSRWWSGGYDYTQRATKREQTRWSLSDWLNIKEKNRAMDQWLSVNSPSPFEFMLGGSYLSYNSSVNDGTTTTENTKTSYAGELSAYAQLVGLTGEYEHNSADNFMDLTGIFNLRILGDSIQNSGLTLSYGMRTRNIEGTDPTRLSQQFGQAQLQLYLTKFFGIDSKYRFFLPTTNDELGEVKADYSEAGLFIDFKGLRVFGAWYKESQKNKVPAATVETITDRTGIRSGLKIFF